jgi:hypothetical protein
MWVGESSRQDTGNISPSASGLDGIGESAREDDESESSWLMDSGSKVKNFEIDGEPKSGTEAGSSAPIVTSANNPSERLDASVGGVTG